MSDKDQKDRLEIESEVIDTLLDAIDDWDLEADFAPTDRFAESGLGGPPTEIDTTGSSNPLSPDDDTFAFQVTSDAIEPDIDSAALMTEGSPLYLPPLEDSDGTDEESTRMIDMRADDSYHDLVRSIRGAGLEEEPLSVEVDVDAAIDVDTPLPVSPDAPTPAPPAGDQLDAPATVMAQPAVTPLLSEEEEETHIYQGGEGPAVIAQDQQKATPIAPDPSQAEQPSPWDDQTIVTSQGVSFEAEFEPTPFAGQSESEAMTSGRSEFPSWVDGPPDISPSETGDVDDRQETSEREIPDWVGSEEFGASPSPLPMDAPSPLPMDAPSPLPMDAPSPLPMDAMSPLPMDAMSPLPMDAMSPLPMDAVSPLPTAAPSQPPSAMPSQPPPSAMPSQPPPSAMPSQPPPSAMPSQPPPSAMPGQPPPSAMSSQPPPPMPSLPPIPPASEDHLPQALKGTMDRLLPQLGAEFPGVAVALPSSEELLSRLEAYQQPPSEGGPAPTEPVELATRCETAAEGCADVAEAAGFLCEAARIHERLLDGFERARELYHLSLQLEPSFMPAVSGQRRLSTRAQVWEGLQESIETELSMDLSIEERVELMVLQAEYLLSAVQDSGRAVDVAQEIEAISPSDIRADVLRAEVAYLEHDESELCLRALKLIEELNDAELKATLFDVAGRMSETIADFDTASRYFESAAQLSPTSPSVLAAVARTKMSKGDRVGSARALTELSELFGPGVAASSLRRRAATLHLIEGDIDAATGLVAASNTPQDLLILLSAAHIQEDSAAARDALLRLAPVTDDLVRRASYLVEAIITDSEVPSEQLLELLKTCFTSGRNVTASVLRSELARRSQDVDSFVPVAAGGTDGASPFALFRSALTYDSQDRPDKAHELFAQLAVMPKARIEAELVLLVLSAASQSWTTLVDFLHKAVDQSPSPLWKASVMVVLGRIHEFELKDRIAARAGYAQAAELLPSFLPAQQGLLRTAPEGATKVESSRRLADEVASGQDGVTICVEAGRVAEESTDVAAALDSYYAALSSEPSAGLPLIRAERLLRQNERGEELSELWRQSADATTGGLSAFHRLSVAHSFNQQGEHPAAFEELLLAHLAFPSETTAGAIVRFSQNSAAGERLEAVAEDLPASRRESAFLMAAELSMDENPEGALRCVERVLENNPNRSDATMLRERLLPQVGRSEELEAHFEERLAEATETVRKVSLQEQLIVLANGRGDLAAETERREAMLELDAHHLPTLQWLATRYLSDQRWADLARVFELLAKEVNDKTDAAAFAAMAIRLYASSTEVCFDRLELAELAVSNLPKDLRSLVNLYSAARVAHRWDLVLEASVGLGSVLGLPRERSVFELRRADALEALERFDEAEEVLVRAAGSDEPHPIASWRLSRIAEGQEHFATAAEAAEAAAEVAFSPEHKTQEYLRAARIWLEKAGDAGKALLALKGAMTVDPSCDEAYELAKSAMTEDTDPALSLDLISLRLKSDQGKDETIEMATRGADLAFSLQDRERAKSLLKTALEAEPTNIEALRKLGDAFAEDEEWPDAAQCFIHLGRLIKEPKESMGYYHRLGVIYQEKTPDQRKAIASFQKVLSFDANHLDTLRRLSKLLVEASEWKASCDITTRLTQVEPLPELKRDALIRLAHAHETGLSDTRSAEQALDEARRLDPTDITIVDAIAAFYSRQGAQQALMVHLDRAAADFRRVLEANPCDMSAYSSLFKVFKLRKAEDLARMAAAVLEAFGAVKDDERELLSRYQGATWMPGPAVADIRLDDDLSPLAVPASFRTLFRQVGDGLSRLAPYDARRLGLGRGQRASRGSPLFELAQAMMPWYGLSGIELYLHPSEPMMWMPLASPPALVFGQALVEECSEGELRFLLGRGFALLQRKLAIVTQLPPERLGLLVPAIVKLVYPVFDAEGVDESALSEMVREVGKALPKRVRQEAGTYASECVGELRVGPEELAAQVESLADRAGMLSAGGLVPALLGLRRLSGRPVPKLASGALDCATSDARSGALLQFFVSRAHASAREKLGFASPL